MRRGWSTSLLPSCNREIRGRRCSIPRRRRTGPRLSISGGSLCSTTGGMRQETKNSLRTTGARVANLPIPLRNRSGGQLPCGATARATTFDSRPTITGEPTSVPGVPETAQVENIIRAFRDAGEKLILISHNMLEEFDLIERIVPFRRGRMVANPRRVESDGQEGVARVAGARSGRGTSWRRDSPAPKPLPLSSGTWRPKAGNGSPPARSCPGDSREVRLSLLRSPGDDAERIRCSRWTRI